MNYLWIALFLPALICLSPGADGLTKLLIEITGGNATNTTVNEFAQKAALHSNDTSVNITVSDADECTSAILNTCSNTADCTNVVGSFSCECHSGFMDENPANAGKNCTDINECLRPENHTCTENATCINTVGHYNCVCSGGFSGNGTICIDIDECTENATICDAIHNSTCTNTIGSYNCSCDVGYIKDKGTCTDADECELNIYNCTLNSKCNNTDGSYLCICSDGYTRNDTVCLDVDECALFIDYCDTNATCINSDGSFDCTCNDGFVGNGTYCDDIDECDLNSHDCSANSICNNTAGSFICSCTTGFTGNGTVCEDFNECQLATDNYCSTNASCLNTVGSYVCTCSEGFTGDGYNCAVIPELTTTTTTRTRAESPTEISTTTESTRPSNTTVFLVQQNATSNDATTEFMQIKTLSQPTTPDEVSTLGKFITQKTSTILNDKTTFFNENPTIAEQGTTSQQTTEINVASTQYIPTTELYQTTSTTLSPTLSPTERKTTQVQTTTFESTKMSESTADIITTTFSREDSTPRDQPTSPQPTTASSSQTDTKEQSSAKQASDLFTTLLSTPAETEAHSTQDQQQVSTIFSNSLESTVQSTTNDVTTSDVHDATTLMEMLTTIKEKLKPTTESQMTSPGDLSTTNAIISTLSVAPKHSSVAEQSTLRYPTTNDVFEHETSDTTSMLSDQTSLTTASNSITDTFEHQRSDTTPLTSDQTSLASASNSITDAFKHQQSDTTPLTSDQTSLASASNSITDASEHQTSHTTPLISEPTSLTTASNSITDAFEHQQSDTTPLISDQTSLATALDSITDTSKHQTSHTTPFFLEQTSLTTASHSMIDTLEHQPSDTTPLTTDHTSLATASDSTTDTFEHQTSDTTPLILEQTSLTTASNSMIDTSEHQPSDTTPLTTDQTSLATASDSITDTSEHQTSDTTPLILEQTSLTTASGRIIHTSEQQTSDTTPLISDQISVTPASDSTADISERQTSDVTSSVSKQILATTASDRTTDMFERQTSDISSLIFELKTIPATSDAELPSGNILTSIEQKTYTTLLQLQPTSVTTENSRLPTQSTPDEQMYTTTSERHSTKIATAATTSLEEVPANTQPTSSDAISTDTAIPTSVSSESISKPATENPTVLTIAAETTLSSTTAAATYQTSSTKAVTTQPASATTSKGFVAAIDSILNALKNSTSVTSEQANDYVDQIIDSFSRIKPDSNGEEASNITQIVTEILEKVIIPPGEKYKIDTPELKLEAFDINFNESNEAEVIAFDGQVILPNKFLLSSKVREKREITPDSLRLVFSQYSDASLFVEDGVRSISDDSNNENISFTNNERIVNSAVVGASIGGRRVENSPESIQIKINLILIKDSKSEMENGTVETIKYKNPKCSWWDYDNGEWSTKGCAKGSESLDHITCECNHLTHFAVVMQVEVMLHDIVLTYMSYIGAGLSIAGLMGTILSYSIFKSLRKHRSKKILLHFCSALMGVYFAYLFGIAARLPRNQAQCIASGFFLHFFTLSVITWMSVEVFDMYIMFVKILWNSFHKHMLKACLYAWLMPFIISIITVGTHLGLPDKDIYPRYEENTVCWLGKNGMLYGFIVPSCIILMFNLIIFSSVLYNVTCKRSNKRITRIRSTSKSIKTSQHIINALALLLLAGPTWIIGYFINLDPIHDGVLRRTLSYIFVILNGFQGLWIFIVFSVRPAPVRKRWIAFFMHGSLNERTSVISSVSGTQRYTEKTITSKSPRLSVSPHLISINTPTNLTVHNNSKRPIQSTISNVSSDSSSSSKTFTNCSRLCPEVQHKFDTAQGSSGSGKFINREDKYQDSVQIEKVSVHDSGRDTDSCRSISEAS